MVILRCKQGSCDKYNINICCACCCYKINCDNKCIYTEDVNTENECKFIIKSNRE